MEAVTKYKFFDTEKQCINYEKRESTMSRMYEDIYLGDADINELYDWIAENINDFIGDCQ